MVNMPCWEAGEINDFVRTLRCRCFTPILKGGTEKKVPVRGGLSLALEKPSKAQVDYIIPYHHGHTIPGINIRKSLVLTCED